MKTAGIIIDSWKLPIFKKYLDATNFSYTGASMYRPMSFLEFQDLKNKGAELQCTCILCNEEFSNKNVHSVMGWRETQITGYCENCWVKIFDDNEEGIYDND